MEPTTPPEEGIIKKASSGLIHRPRTKRYLVDRAKKTGRPFRRVSKETLDDLDAKFRTMCDNRVHSSPGRKTL